MRENFLKRRRREKEHKTEMRVLVKCPCREQIEKDFPNMGSGEFKTYSGPELILMDPKEKEELERRRKSKQERQKTGGETANADEESSSSRFVKISHLSILYFELDNGVKIFVKFSPQIRAGKVKSDTVEGTVKIEWYLSIQVHCVEWYANSDEEVLNESPSQHDFNPLSFLQFQAEKNSEAYKDNGVIAVLMKFQLGRKSRVFKLKEIEDSDILSNALPVKMIEE